MFETILIANRGEIACRVVRTCRRLGIRTVAVYSDADAGARHVREADAAVRIGPASARQSYLDAAAVVRAARATGADAIHPGYGFLSEKVELIDACAAAGIVFIGPHRDAIAQMGSKIDSKRIARAAGVPCVPGYDGDDQHDDRLRAQAVAIGFPLLIKASAGGGGKGMKRVDALDAFDDRLRAARGEALAAFADDRVLLERCIERPRHLEVQLLGDRHGGLVHLFERECSIQRNFQKLIEEAPAHHLGDAMRTKLFAAALALGRAIRYDSTGTVEFIVDADDANEQDASPYFLEVNTRLQVEHPVTEETLRIGDDAIDLVERQIRSAAGERLGFAQGDVRRCGWAIEARVNAEVPDDDFRASSGLVTGYDEPAAAGVRIDSGIDGGSIVTPHYDAMLAKVVGFAADRDAARARLDAGLRSLRIEGLATNQPLLVDIVGAPAFAAVLTTRFLGDAFAGGWRPAAADVDRRAAVAAAVWFLDRVHRRRSDRPLDTLVGFRVTAAAGRRGATSIHVGGRDAPRVVDVEPTFVAHADAGIRASGGLTCRLDGVEYFVDGDRVGVTCDGRRYRASLAGDAVALWNDGTWSTQRVVAAVAAVPAAARAGGGGDVIASDLPGVVTGILVTAGQSITAGMPVVVVEAMKLFHTLVAPRDGVVAAVRVTVGATIERGAALVELSPASASGTEAGAGDAA